VGNGEQYFYYQDRLHTLIGLYYGGSHAGLPVLFFVLRALGGAGGDTAHESAAGFPTAETEQRRLEGGGDAAREMG
jgi:hypothetical protein